MSLLVSRLTWPLCRTHVKQLSVHDVRIDCQAFGTDAVRIGETNVRTIGISG